MIEDIKQFRTTSGVQRLSDGCISFVAYICRSEKSLDLSPIGGMFFAEYSAKLSRYAINGNARLASMTNSRNAACEAMLAALRVAGQKGASVFAKADDSALSFEVWMGPAPSAVGFVQVCLPIGDDPQSDYLAAGAFFSRLAAIFDFESGHVGPSIFWDSTDARAKQQLGSKLREWAELFPGLMSSSGAAGAYRAADGVVDIGWLTFLGPQLFARVRDSVAMLQLSELSNIGVQIAPAGSALMLKTADLPGIDASSPDVIGRFHVGRVLRPFWNEERNGLQTVPGFGREDDVIRARWLNRFFSKNSR